MGSAGGKAGGGGEGGGGVGGGPAGGGGGVAGGGGRMGGDGGRQGGDGDEGGNGGGSVMMVSCATLSAATGSKVMSVASERAAAKLGSETAATDELTSPKRVNSTLKALPVEVPRRRRSTAVTLTSLAAGICWATAAASCSVASESSAGGGAGEEGGFP